MDSLEMDSLAGRLEVDSLEMDNEKVDSAAMTLRRGRTAHGRARRARPRPLQQG